ncbi:MAG: hypothetical protein L6Q57_01765 [Alphaproteobacteria bacterium]|nr:hypothetical protein [Alphaproteobacteria bacterium]
MSLTDVFTKAAKWGGALLLGAILTEPIVFCFSHFNMGGIALMSQLSTWLNPWFDALGLTDAAYAGAQILGFDPVNIATGMGANISTAGDLIIR